MKEEIKEYLKRVDELELKLTEEDKDTYQWLLFGYNECARLLNEKEEVIKEAMEYVESRAKKAGVKLMPREIELLEILSKGENK